MQQSSRHTLLIGILLYALLILAYFAHAPGLDGLFILDDIPNLEALKQIQQFSLSEISRFVFTGISSSLGRPVSLTSFALQYNSWPHTPYVFKYANLMLHLLNGVLVFWLSLKLLDLSQPRNQRNLIIALFTAALWLLHPLQVSTVSYVIQRMTELAALFSFITIIAYLYGRQWTIEGQYRQGLVMMSSALLIGLPLAILSKENGILIPVFIVILEWTLLAGVKRPAYWRFWAMIFLALPIIMLLGYLFIHAESFFIKGYSGRNFNLEQRLLTESRILLDYLRLFIFPVPSELGLYFDDYPISTSLLSPVTTLLSLLMLCILVTIAALARKHYPMFCFAVLWFLGGHLLESTALPLELVFLHRNYVPLLGPCLATVYYSYALISHIQHRWIKQYIRVAAISLLCVFTLITNSESIVWGRTMSQAKIWAEEKPSSKRAQDWYASTLIMQNKVADAMEVFTEKARRYPQDSTPYLQMMEAACYDKNLPVLESQKIFERLRHAPRFDSTTLNLMIMLVRHKESGMCHTLKTDFLMRMIDTLAENPGYESFKYKLHMLRGRTYNIEGIYWKALSAYEQSYQLNPSINTLLDMIRIAAEASRVDLVEHFVKQAKEDPKLPVIQRAAFMDIIIGYEAQLNNILKKE